MGDLTISLGAVVAVFAVIGGVTAALFYFRFYRESGAQKANETAVKNWRELAESRKAKLDALEEELAEVRLELKSTERERDDAVESRNECAQENLRLQARQRRLERVVNDLQRKCGIPETDFDDPVGVHRTDGGNLH